MGFGTVVILAGLLIAALAIFARSDETITGGTTRTLITVALAMLLIGLLAVVYHGVSAVRAAPAACERPL